VTSGKSEEAFAKRVPRYYSRLYRNAFFPQEPFFFSPPFRVAAYFSTAFDYAVTRNSWRERIFVQRVSNSSDCLWFAQGSRYFSVSRHFPSWNARADFKHALRKIFQ